MTGSGPLVLRNGRLATGRAVDVTLQNGRIAAIDDADPQAALDRSRFQIEEPDGGGSVALETGVPDATYDGLAQRGHRVTRAHGWARVAFGRGQIIRRETDGVWVAGSDPRADGCAMTL